MSWLSKKLSIRRQGNASSRPGPNAPQASSSQSYRGVPPPSLVPIPSPASLTSSSAQFPYPPPVQNASQISSSQSYGEAPQPSPAFSASSGSPSAQSPYPPDGSFRLAPSAPQISSSQSYQGPLRPSPAPIHVSPSFGSSSTQSPPPGGGFLQPQGNYAQHSGTSHSSDASFPGGFQMPGNNNTTSPSVPTGSVPYPSSFESPGVPSRTASVTSSHFGSQAPQGAQPDPVRDECYAWFLSVDEDSNGHVSREELGRALFNDRGRPFSESAVEYLMRIFDMDGNGSITFEEFAPLWSFMIRWRRLFVEFDVNCDGTISADELVQALVRHEFDIGRPVIELLLDKYGAPRQSGQEIPHLTMDWFICACIIVEKLCELYGDIYLSGDQPRMHRDDFLVRVISLP